MTTRPERALEVGLSAADPRAVAGRRALPATMLIGDDPHKYTDTATAVAPETNRDLGSVRIEATVAEYERMLQWAAHWPQRQWAIENAAGMGRHLAT